MPQKYPPPPITIQTEVTQFAMTAEGDIIYHPLKKPPASVAVACKIEGCGTLNWPHSTVCSGCAHDRRWWVKHLFRVAVLILLLLILAGEFVR
ncbi:hypothetical protein SAMN05216359_105313 [Roseateles sp. YR242]|nr:hypothetical protein SAMN05216359_105313 [Roseateles sp. YR242]